MLTCRASPAERVGQCYRLTVPGAIVARTPARSAACHRRDVSATGGAPTIAFSQRPGVLRVLQSTRAPPTAWVRSIILRPTEPLYFPHSRGSREARRHT